MNPNPSFFAFTFRVLTLSLAAWLAFAFITHLAMNLYQYLKQ
jgi:hypothetical protein